MSSKFIVFTKSVLAVVFDSVCGPFWCTFAVLNVEVVERVLVLDCWKGEFFSTEVVWEQGWYLIGLSVEDTVCAFNVSDSADSALCKGRLCWIERYWF